VPDLGMKSDTDDRDENHGKQNYKSGTAIAAGSAWPSKAVRMALVQS
jgi:hypothetical protein